MSNNVQFQADFPQITLGKKTKILLEIPEGTTFAKIAEIAQHRGERIIVQFGNPQLAMDFKPHESSRQGLVATVNERGEVESVESDENDEDQGELFPQDELHDGSSDAEGDSINPDPDDDNEMDFEESEEADPLPGEDEPAGIAEIDREQIEEYILREQPVFDDIPFNFSELLRRRREDELTWIDLAKEAGVPSTKLQSSYQVFKKRVVRMMQEDGVA